MQPINQGSTGKSERQARLLEVVKRDPVRSQNELVFRMRECGYPVTQASVSRDMRELGLIKIDGHYAHQTSGNQATPESDASDPISGLVTRIESVGANLVVVRTRIGAASTVAAALDEKRLPQIIGTVAGDDTIFIAVRSRSSQGQLIAALHAWAPDKE